PSRSPTSWRLVSGFGFQVLCCHLFLVALLRDHAYAGNFHISLFSWTADNPWITVCSVVAATGFCLLLSKRLTGAWWRLGQLAPVRVFLAGLLLAGLGWFIRQQASYYCPEIWAIWHVMRKVLHSRISEQLIVIAAAFLGSGLVLGKDRL